MLLNNEQNAAKKTEYEEKIKSAKKHLKNWNKPNNGFLRFVSLSVFCIKCLTFSTTLLTIG